MSNDYQLISNNQINKDIIYSSVALFGKNHIKSTQILEKIRNNKILEILDGLTHVKENNLIIELKYLKYFGNANTYDIILNYADKLITTLLSKYETIDIRVNLQSISLVDFEKQKNFCKYLNVFFREKYPNILNKCYVYNVSFIFETIFNAAKYFIDAETLNKIVPVKE